MYIEVAVEDEKQFELLKKLITCIGFSNSFHNLKIGRFVFLNFCAETKSGLHITGYGAKLTEQDKTGCHSYFDQGVWRRVKTAYYNVYQFIDLYFKSESIHLFDNTAPETVEIEVVNPLYF